MNAQDRVALVTGGAKRVGRAICLELARAGCHVAVHYRKSIVEARSTARSVESLNRRTGLFQADLEDHAAPGQLVQAVLDKMGRLDILVNNASVFELAGAGRLEEFDSGVWHRVFQVNTLAPTSLAAAAAEGMNRAGSGKIINLCDISADRPWANHLAYCASKAALVCVTKALARKLAPRIQVNGISPGIAEFPEHYDATTRRRLVEQVPMKRAGSPEAIAQAVRFVVEGPDYLTGEIVAVDGGRHLTG